MFGRQDLPKARRVVVKVGTSTLTHGTGKLNLEQMEKLVRQLADLSNRGHQVMLVTSGAVGAGMGRLGLEKRPKSVPEKQACAAVGQGILMHMYEKIFAEYGLVVAQVLLTRDDFAFRERYINAGNTLEALLRMNVIPIINENDTVAIDEIRLRFGDNDTLSALVAGLVQGDVLILLTDIDGLYSANPRVDPEAVFIPEVPEITPEIEAMAAGAGTNLGTGGMATKLQAAKIAVESGVAMVIAQGSRPNGLREIMNGAEVGTLFIPNETPLPGYKRWLAFGSASSGSVHIDAGAAEAIVLGGKSLLPCGVTGAEGDFQSGDMVSIISPEGLEVARGVTQYSADQVRRIMGKQCQDIEAALGMKGVDEVVHRDNLTVMVSRHIG
ncbi:glutamate 5-kinase [Heliobacterium undosum]|uniref:Glutamate 5-kinase n=1 Tax=Heliomicrobium undosum TaxID=121734 RepID=A0A845L0S8_9FIRM|nr:glutamate 5-kinase [Heliomicrobium undosum]MZP30122.1 glutamate 5-kinase [Heliomicrobium undosum]